MPDKELDRLLEELFAEYTKRWAVAIVQVCQELELQIRVNQSSFHNKFGVVDSHVELFSGDHHVEDVVISLDLNPSENGMSHFYADIGLGNGDVFLLLADAHLPYNLELLDILKTQLDQIDISLQDQAKDVLRDYYISGKPIPYDDNR